MPVLAGCDRTDAPDTDITDTNIIDTNVTNIGFTDTGCNKEQTQSETDPSLVKGLTPGVKYTMKYCYYEPFTFVFERGLHLIIDVDSLKY